MSFTEIGGLYGKNSVHERKKGTQIWVAGNKIEPVNFRPVRCLSQHVKNAMRNIILVPQTFKRLYKIWEWNSKGI